MTDLNTRIVACERCPRLRTWCLQVALEKRAAHRHEEYWGRPVPNFGNASAERLIVGLAPAAHGANRTGRMFTGDRSGLWLYRALHEVGLATQPTYEQADDGLELRGVMITAAVHCAPPGNKPTTEEISQCGIYLDEILNERVWRSVLCLGAIAWREVHRHLRRKAPKFCHGQASAGRPLVLASYHPSQQNTFTGRLTQPMLRQVLERFATD